MEIEDSIKVVKQAQAAEARAKRERDKLHEIWIKQRDEIRRLQRLLSEVIKLVPDKIRADKLFERVDAAIHRDVL